MKSYLCINGKKTELTDEQVRDLGFAPGKYTVAELSKIVASGNARDRLQLHEVINIGGLDLEIIGFDHDKDRDDPNRPTITLMAKTLLAARRWHSGDCKRGWIDAEIRAWLNEEYINKLPEELIPHIRSVEKLTHDSDGEAYITVDRLFLPSESELFGSAIWAAAEDGPRYEAFATSDDRIRIDEDGDADWYWTRSVRGGHSAYCAIVSVNGHAHISYAGDASIRAPLCFCFA